jgi:kynurenine 3-monooxygenase
MLHSVDGQTEFLPYGQREHEVIYSVSRQKLNSLLLTAAEDASDVNVAFNQKITDIDFDAKQLVSVDLSGDKNQTHSFEVLIGADGAGSRVRSALIARTKGESRSEFLDHDYKELEIPAVDGKHVIEREALHIWPRGGYMLIALPNLDGSFTVTLFLPKTGEPSFASLDDPAKVLAFFEQKFPGALSLMPDLVEDYQVNPAGRLGTVYCSPWHFSDCGLILGDASHAIVPFHGQGMNAGFEDCSELVRLLEESDHDWAMTLPQFTEQRKPNADAIAQMAIENYTTMRSSVADEKFQLKKEVGFELERRFPDLFIPRYSLVMFHRVPYAVAKEQGERQAKLLDVLTQKVHSIEQVDMELAERLVRNQFDSNTGD